MLESIGVISDCAIDGSRAVDMIKQRQQRADRGLINTKQYKLIFMDYSMPEMNGCEATKLILDFCADEPPFICCITAYLDKEFKAMVLHSGMKKFCSKPISLDQVIPIL